MDAIAQVRSGNTPANAPTAPSGAILNGANAPAEAVDPPSHHSATQPRDENGQFAALDAQVAGEAPSAEAEAAPEGDTPGDEQPEAESGADAGGEFVPFVLAGEPARGEEDIVIEFPNDPVVQERLKRLQNGAMRRKEYEEAMGTVERQRAEAEQVITTATLDPAGFANDYFPPEAKQALVLSWLSDPAFLDAVRDDVAVLDDETQRRRVAAEARLKLEDARKTVANTLAERQQNRAITQTITTALTALVPESLPPAAREVWISDRQRELANYVASGAISKQHLANPLNLPSVLGPTLQAWGVEHPMQRIASALEMNAAPATSPALRAPAAAVTTPNGRPANAANAANAAPNRVSPRVDQVRQTQQARQQAAQTGSVGVGAPLASPEVVAPGPNSLDRSIKAMRDRLRAGAA